MPDNSFPIYWPITGWTRASDQQNMDLIPIDIAKDSDYYLATLPVDNHTYLLIRDFIEQTIRQMPSDSPKREKTRMSHAEKKRDNVRSSAAIKKAAAYRLLEGNDGGPKPPHSCPITIREMKVVKNAPLWEMFNTNREEISRQLQNQPNPLAPIKWSFSLRQSAPGFNSGLPVVDPKIGEVMLFHGTSDYFANLIIKGGFRPDMGRADGIELDGRVTEKPSFGFLGQGTYFSDNFGKTMTYGSCSNCEDFECNCRDANGKKYPRVTILSRTILGSPDTRSFVSGKEKIHRSQSIDLIEPGKHSVYTKGWDVSHNIFSAGSGSNEFLVKRTQQAYPEILVYYVLGFDDEDVRDALKRALDNYQSYTHYNQSSESKSAYNTLSKMTNIGHQTRALPETVEGCIRWYLGDRGAQKIDPNWGEPLKRDSSLFENLAMVTLRTSPRELDKYTFLTRVKEALDTYRSKRGFGITASSESTNALNFLQRYLNTANSSALLPPIIELDDLISWYVGVPYSAQLPNTGNQIKPGSTLFNILNAIPRLQNVYRTHP